MNAPEEYSARLDKRACPLHPPQVDKHELVHGWKLRYRDLVVVDPTIPLPMPSVLLVRARAILAHLDAGGAVRAIVAENQVLVLSLPKVRAGESIVYI